MRGRAWLGKGEREDAGDGWDKASALYPKALDDCDEALSIDPNLVDAYITRGESCMRRGKLDKAFADFDKAIALDPKSARAYCRCGHARVFTAEYDKTIADCDKALAIDPKLADAYNHRGGASGR